MPKYLIERDIPGIQNMSPRDLQAISIKSRRVLEQLGPQIQWQNSFVMEDRLYCLYLADGEERIRQHALRGEFPITAIREITAVIDPSTADGYLFDKHL